MHGEFSRPTRDDVGSDRVVWRVLPDGCRYKEMADHSTDPDAKVTDDATDRIIADAVRFVARVAEVLAPDRGA